MNIKHLVLAGSLAFASSAALANNVEIDVPFIGDTATFGAIHTDSLAFTDVFTFDVGPGLWSVDASLVTIGAGLQNIDFSSADINGVALTIDGPGFFEAAFTPTSVDLTGPIILTVTGTSDAANGINASYSATVNVSQVPVPAAAWLFGSALMGLVAVKRRNA